MKQDEEGKIRKVWALLAKILNQARTGARSVQVQQRRPVKTLGKTRNCHVLLTKNRCSFIFFTAHEKARAGGLSFEHIVCQSKVVPQLLLDSTCYLDASNHAIANAKHDKRKISCISSFG